ncbi:hypothetical protein [Mycoplasma parvum]|nr:hypothetical protein [Mycoplasma parvum]
MLFWFKKKKIINLLYEADIQLENEVIWEVKNLEKKPFNYYFEYGEVIDWGDKSSKLTEKERKVLSEKQIEDKLEEIKEKESLVKPAEKIGKENIVLPAVNKSIKGIKKKGDEKEAKRRVKKPKEADKLLEDSLKKEKGKKNPFKKLKEKEESAPLDLLKMQTIQENLDVDNLFPKGPLSSRNVEKDLEDEEHDKMLKEREKDEKEDQRLSLTYNLKDFPLAEPELINELCEAHKVFFDFLSRLQETHTPTDFKTAYHIQDRIAYLLDNQTLLYRSLTKQLIKYLNRINEKLKKYYQEITIKQEDLRKINAQISRFNEYDRKTHDRLDYVEKENIRLREDVKNYQDKLDAVTRIEKDKKSATVVKKS